MLWHDWRPLFSQPAPGRCRLHAACECRRAWCHPPNKGFSGELVGSQRLGMAVGWLEMLYIAAVLIGSLAGGWAFDHWTKPSGRPLAGRAVDNPDSPAQAPSSPLAIFQGFSPPNRNPPEPFRFMSCAETFHARRRALAGEAAPTGCAGERLFLFVWRHPLSTLVQLGRELHAGKIGSVTETGSCLCFSAAAW